MAKRNIINLDTDFGKWDLTKEDKQIFEIIVTLGLNNKNISLTAISNHMFNKTSTHQLNKIKDSIKRMSTKRISLDITEELKNFKRYTKEQKDLLQENLTSFKTNTYLLPIEEHNIQFTRKQKNGKETQVKRTYYTFIKSPTLYDYENITSHINKIPTQLIKDLPKNKLSEYIKERIFSRTTPNISFETLRKENLLTTKHKYRELENIKKILNIYIKHNIISDFQINEIKEEITYKKIENCDKNK